jgi:hypothetical protein
LCFWLNRLGPLSTILSGHPFSQFFRIAKVFRAAGLLLVAEQFRAANKVGSDPF